MIMPNDKIESEKSETEDKTSEVSDDEIEGWYFSQG